MSKWRDVCLDDIRSNDKGAVAIGPFGSSLKADLYTPQGVPVVRGTNISKTRAWKGDWVYVADETAERFPNCLLQENDLFFPHRGAIGEVGIVPAGVHDRYLLSSSLLKFRCDTKIANPLYVYYYFRSEVGRQEILRYSSTVGTPGIGQPVTSMRSFRLKLPPIKVQYEIGAILRALDDKIEINNQANSTMELLISELFRDWFVDFGPVRSKAQGRDIDLILPEIAALFPNSFDEESRPIGWELSTIGDEVSVFGGSTPSTKQDEFWIGGNNSWATPKDLSDLLSPVLLRTERKLTDSGVSQISSGILPSGTVLLSSRAPIGYLAITEIPTAINQGFVAMSCKGRLSNLFALFWCKENMARILQYANGSTFQEISKSNFKRISVVVPNIELLQAFDAFARPFYSRMVANLKENENLFAIRDMLLPKLISGEVHISDAERVLEASV